MSTDPKMNTESKPRSLKAAANPQARMQELLRQKSRPSDELRSDELRSEIPQLDGPMHEERTNEASNVATNAETNVTPLQGTNVTELQTRKPDRKPIQNQSPVQPAATSAKKSATEKSIAENRVQAILDQLAEDEIAVVTVRVFSRLNSYMDRYVERRNRALPKERYRKQDAVNEAFASFVADHPMPPIPDDDGL